MVAKTTNASYAKYIGNRKPSVAAWFNAKCVKLGDLGDAVQVNMIPGKVYRNAVLVEHDGMPIWVRECDLC